MGGKKKLSLSQMEKLQARRERERRAALAAREKKTSSIFVPEVNDEVLNELKKMKVLTPYNVASRFDLRVSVAKDFLEELHKKGLIEFVSKSRKIKVYKVAA